MNESINASKNSVKWAFGNRNETFKLKNLKDRLMQAVFFYARF